MHILLRFAETYLPGWLYLVIGVVLIALTILVPPWKTGEQLRDQYDLMREQVRILKHNRLVLHEVYTALNLKDPHYSNV